MSRIAYTNCDPLNIGCTLYQSSSLTNPWGAGFYYDGVECWQVNSSGVIIGTGTCVPFDCSGPNCKNWEYSSIPSGGDIIYYYSCFDGTLQSIAVSDGDPNGNFCNCNTIGAPFTSVSPGGTTLTEIGTCASTTTTTEPPPNCFENTTINVTDTGWIRWTKCDGTIVNYFINALGTFTITDCIEQGTIRIATPFADLASWNNVVNGTACGTTTTTTTAGTTTTTAATTTTTTAQQYDYYYADAYDCNGCQLSQSNLLVAFPAGQTVIDNGTRYYIAEGGPDGFSYNVTGAAPSGFAAYILSNIWGSFTSCNVACSV